MLFEMLKDAWRIANESGAWYVATVSNQLFVLMCLIIA